MSQWRTLLWEIISLSAVNHEEILGPKAIEEMNGIILND